MNLQNDLFHDIKKEILENGINGSLSTIVRYEHSAKLSVNESGTMYLKFET